MISAWSTASTPLLERASIIYDGFARFVELDTKPHYDLFLALIMSRINHCNSLFASWYTSVYDRAAAASTKCSSTTRSATWAAQPHHTRSSSPALVADSWTGPLYKLCVLMHDADNGRSPAYISDPAATCLGSASTTATTSSHVCQPSLENVHFLLRALTLGTIYLMN